ncbi:MAG: 2-phosphosulfolactate phosphatase, partial [Nitrosopumilus sp.]
MKIEIIYSFQNANKAKGLAVIIDVFRAFSTACFVINNGAKMIISVDDIDLAYNLRKENPEYVLMGERNDIMPDGFDFGNSP